MTKKILAICFSQTGQLSDIIDNITAPIAEAGFVVDRVVIEMANPYSFPWTADSFFSVMPDCVLGVPAQLAPLQLREEDYDLIVLGYQPWFLSPSIPFNSLMQEPQFTRVLKNTPVITVSGARNMWVSAYEGVRRMLRDADARHVATISLVDKHLNLVSFVTIFHWMLHGRKDRYLGIFPKPGVSDIDIAHAKVFGTIVLCYLKNSNWEGLQAELLAKKAVVLKHHLLFIEGKASVMFRVWARFIVKRKNRRFWLRVFRYYLMIALFVAAPIAYFIDKVFFSVFLRTYVQAKKESVLKLN